VDAFAYQMTLANTNSDRLDAAARCRRTPPILLWKDEAVLRQFAPSRLAQSRLAQSRLARLFTRFAAGTVVSTACSQLTLVLLFGILETSASVSGGAAFLAGAIPNFLIHRFWTWRRSGPVMMRRELLPYLAVITLSGLVAIGITTGVDRVLNGTIDDHAVHTAVLAITFIISYLPLFVLKFALLDRLVFGCADRGLSQRSDPRRLGRQSDPRRHRAQDSRNQVPTSARA
jgi:putative flippase GtrA